MAVADAARGGGGVTTSSASHIAVVEVDGAVTDAVQADLKSNPAILTVRPVEFLA